LANAWLSLGLVHFGFWFDGLLILYIDQKPSKKVELRGFTGVV
jgi:hypothetical protein